MLAASRNDELTRLATEGLTYGRLAMTENSQYVGADADRLDDYSFLIAESQVLLHHAAEALLRLFLAHEGRPPCPWLRAGSLRASGRLTGLLTSLGAP